MYSFYDRYTWGCWRLWELILWGYKDVVNDIVRIWMENSKMMQIVMYSICIFCILLVMCYKYFIYLYIFFICLLFI
jgi:hypothetical protein